MASRKASAELDEAQHLLDNLKITFLETLPERCNEQDILVLALDGADQSEFTPTYDELYRSVHSLKGSAGTHGIQIISVICHQLEDFMEGLNGKSDNVNQDFINHCLSYLDLIRKAGTEAATDNPDFDFVQEALKSIHNLPFTSRKSVLIVESSTSMAMLYKDALSELPLQITMIDDGLKALELLLHKRFNFIITGKALKTLNGAALISALRSSESPNTKIKTIMLSSTSNMTFRMGSKPDYLIQRDERMHVRLATVVTKIIES